MPWQNNMHQQTAQPHMQPLLSSSTPDRSETRPLRDQSGSSSALHSNHSLFTNPDARQFSKPLHSGASTAAAAHTQDRRQNNVYADSTWVPGALNLRIGANELGQRNFQATSQQQAVRRNTSDLMTGQSGLTTGAFELGPDLQKAATSAMHASEPHQPNADPHTQQADQVRYRLLLSVLWLPDTAARSVMNCNYEQVSCNNPLGC